MLKKLGHVRLMKLKGTKSDKSAKKRRKEFMESANLSHAHLEDKKNACRSFHFLLLARHRCNNEVLRECIIAHVSEKSHFSGHTDTIGLNDSNLSQKLRMSMWRH